MLPYLKNIKLSWDIWLLRQKQNKKNSQNFISVTEDKLLTDSKESVKV